MVSGATRSIHEESEEPLNGAAFLFSAMSLSGVGCFGRASAVDLSGLYLRHSSVRFLKGEAV